MIVIGCRDAAIGSSSPASRRRFQWRLITGGALGEANRTQEQEKEDEEEDTADEEGEQERQRGRRGVLQRGPQQVPETGASGTCQGSQVGVVRLQQ